MAKKAGTTGKGGLVDRVYAVLALTYFLIATLMLMLLALAIVGIAIWEGVLRLLEGKMMEAVLDAIAALIIGFAIMETANFVAEEELIRKRELRSSRESRRSLTKFITILVIAMSLEALVMVFRSSSTDPQTMIYPTALFAVAMFALLALGAYQWMSSRVAADGHNAEKAEPGSG